MIVTAAGRDGYPGQRAALIRDLTGQTMGPG